ncbi:MAG: DUF2094 domain-containing protein [Deltaproteobacteria bacterium]|nr:DUF2094 domain-containing protein [Deltaproteobacteria bacterium]
MLGSIKSSQHWQWSAFGKHPGIKDFFNLGHGDPLTAGFSDWVKSGYQQGGVKKNSNSFFSWRFWARGFKKQCLACGLVRDSSDSLGRPYPILIMGTGLLNGWEEYWDLLPYACETTWNRMEYISSRMFNNLKQMEEEVQGLQPPLAYWEEGVEKRKGFRNCRESSSFQGCSRDLLNSQNQALSLLREKEILVSFDEGTFQEQSTWIGFWHFLFKEQEDALPNALFMGGTLEKTFLAGFKRPLIPADFVRLWSVSSSGGS